MKINRRKNKRSFILSSFLCGFLMFSGVSSAIKPDDDPQDYFDAGSAKIKVTRIKERGNTEKKGRQFFTVFLIVATATILPSLSQHTLPLISKFVYERPKPKG